MRVLPVVACAATLICFNSLMNIASAQSCGDPAQVYNAKPNDPSANLGALGSAITPHAWSDRLNVKLISCGRRDGQTLVCKFAAKNVWRNAAGQFDTYSFNATTDSQYFGSSFVANGTNYPVTLMQTRFRTNQCNPLDRVTLLPEQVIWIYQEFPVQNIGRIGNGAVLMPGNGGQTTIRVDTIAPTAPH